MKCIYNSGKNGALSNIFKKNITFRVYKNNNNFFNGIA